MGEVWASLRREGQGVLAEWEGFGKVAVGRVAMIEIKDKSVEELRELNWRRMLQRRNIPEYAIWQNMKQRCNNPNGGKRYRNWGGRGITVCPEWQEDFWAWLQHIGRRPVDGLTQERIDNDRGYEPGNVRWDTYRAQTKTRGVCLRSKPGNTRACLCTPARIAGRST
jgi:hypothetical protein